MKTLLWREWRWSRLLVIEGLVLFFLPYVIALVLLAWPWENKSVSQQDFANVIIGAAASSYVFSQLTLTCLGGNAIAGERADRSAEFLAYLPIAKGERLKAKLLYIAINATLIWGINWLVIGGFHELIGAKIQDFLDVAKIIAAGSLAAFGVAWAVSSFQSSSTFAICAGIVAPLVVGMSLTFVNWALEYDLKTQQHFMETVAPIACLVLGILGFALGTWYFLNRVEP